MQKHTKLAFALIIIGICVSGLYLLYQSGQEEFLTLFLKVFITFVLIVSTFTYIVLDVFSVANDIQDENYLSAFISILIDIIILSGGVSAVIYMAMNTK